MKLKRLAQGFVAIILIGAIGNAFSPNSSSSSKTTSSTNSTVTSSTSTTSNASSSQQAQDKKSKPKAPEKPAIVEGWKQTNGRWWYQEADGSYPKDKWKILGDNWDWYYFDDSGYMVTNCWVARMRYVGSDGKMLRDTTTPDGYYVDEKGQWDGKPLPGSDRSTTISNNFEKATVVRVVDGDTIVINRGNGKEKVRLILVNTPETKHPRKGVEYYGKEASNFTKSQLKGRTVYLEKDVSERDRYKRLLRYVWLDIPANQNELGTKCFNAILLREGYAHLSTFPPDVKYVHEFRKFEAEARNKGAGLWG